MFCTAIATPCTAISSSARDAPGVRVDVHVLKGKKGSDRRPCVRDTGVGTCDVAIDVRSVVAIRRAGRAQQITHRGRQRFALRMRR